MFDKCGDDVSILEVDGATWELESTVWEECATQQLEVLSWAPEDVTQNVHGAVWHVDDTTSPIDVILQEGDDVMSTVGTAWWRASDEVCAMLWAFDAVWTVDGTMWLLVGVIWLADGVRCDIARGVQDLGGGNWKAFGTTRSVCATTWSIPGVIWGGCDEVWALEVLEEVGVSRVNCANDKRESTSS